MKKEIDYEEIQIGEAIGRRFKKVRSTLIAVALSFTLVFTLGGCDESAVEDVNESNSDAAVSDVESSSSENGTESTVGESESGVASGDPFEGYKKIEVDGGNQSGHREPNAVVDIGFGDREYYAYTNEHGQLVKVTAKEIILQDESSEPVLSSGRYYPDEAKVPGVESPVLDEGHVIADSLGGVSNAYNITPQNSTLNRHGDQAYMEKVIRDAGGCTDFVAIITYPNTETQIPSHYSYSYTVRGNKVKDDFDNIDPDKANESLNKETPDREQSALSDSDVAISSLDKSAEYVVVKNSGSSAVDITGWKIVSVKGNQNFIFPKHTLAPNTSVKVGDTGKNSDADFHWLDGRGIWNNTESDPAELYDSNGKLVHRFDD